MLHLPHPIKEGTFQSVLWFAIVCPGRGNVAEIKAIPAFMLQENKDGKAGDGEVTFDKAFSSVSPALVSCSLPIVIDFLFSAFLSQMLLMMQKLLKTNVENISQKKHYSFSFIAR